MNEQADCSLIFPSFVCIKAQPLSDLSQTATVRCDEW